MKEVKKMTSNEQAPSPLHVQANNALKLCDKLMQDFKIRADRQKRTFKLLTYSSVSLAIAVTVVSTLTATQGAYLWIVPVISGLSALCTTLLSSTNSQERWIHSRGVQQKLEAESFLYMQNARQYAAIDEDAKIRLFSERLVEIWSESQQGWAQSITKISYAPLSNK
jgi:Protein of unknown function (DUF4231)